VDPRGTRGASWALEPRYSPWKSEGDHPNGFESSFMKSMIDHYDLVGKALEGSAGSAAATRLKDIMHAPSEGISLGRMPHWTRRSISW